MVSDFLLLLLAILPVPFCLALGKGSYIHWMLIQGFCFIALTWTMQPLCFSLYLQPGPAYWRSPNLLAKHAWTWIVSVANDLTCLTGFGSNICINPCFISHFAALFAFPIRPPFPPHPYLSSLFPFFFRPFPFFAAYSVRGGESG